MVQAVLLLSFTFFFVPRHQFCVDLDNRRCVIYKTETISTAYRKTNQLHHTDWVNSRIKRYSEILMVAAGVLVVSPLLITIIILNKLLHPKHKVFYTQLRVGKDNKPFELYKFRTMIDAPPHAKDDDKLAQYANIFQLTKVENSKMITPFGAVLRKFYLDELPQLFNILKGDMALIGPRPIEPYHINLWREQYPEFKNLLRIRCSARPGASGPWQIDNMKFDLTDREIIQRDIDYIRNSSLGYDLRLLFRTAFRVVAGTGQ